MCPFCRSAVVRRKVGGGYCCEKLELVTLRAALDEAVQRLRSDVVKDASIASSDVVETVELVNRSLLAARGRAA